jgi:CheY-like chemotaxis protein
MEKSKKILIVDDDIDVLSVIKTILENEGHTIVMAKDKKEALLKARSEKPDLAICDVMMTTEYEGFELAEALKADEEFKNIPVLMQSSIEVLSSNTDDNQKFARQYFERYEQEKPDVLLVENPTTKKAGIEYRTADGTMKWIPVDGFIRKPVKAKSLIESVERVLAK